MAALSTYNTLGNLMVAMEQLTDFVRLTVDMKSILKASASPIGEPETTRMLERNRELGDKAIELFGKLWQQICEDNKLDPESDQINQLAEHTDLMFSEEAGKRFQKFQVFIKAN